MEWSSRIPMLSRFDLIAHIMPYYARTHKAFLMLSNLCSATRDKLDEFYDEFITSMTEYWMQYKIKLNKYTELNFLPNDLFESYFEHISEDNINALIKFCKEIISANGWYFRSHFMHSKIKIRDSIDVQIKIIKSLYTHVDVLKSTQVVLCKRGVSGFKVQYESSTLDTNWNHAWIILRSIGIILINFVCFTITNHFISSNVKTYFIKILSF